MTARGQQTSRRRQQQSPMSDFRPLSHDQEHSNNHGSAEIEVDVIVPVHNAASTLESTVESALHQDMPTNLNLYVCCYDDGSSDDSWSILQNLRIRFYDDPGRNPSVHLLIERGDQSRGAGFARNRAVDMRRPSCGQCFLCLLDSDDNMHPRRVIEQVEYMLSIEDRSRRERTLIGCNFRRDPPDSTWHYTDWANGLSKERLCLERYREVTLLQPTWMLSRSRFARLGGYIEAPTAESNLSLKTFAAADAKAHPQTLRLIDTVNENWQTLRLAEDLRFFYAHLADDGLLHRVDGSQEPLLVYRHRANQSQSSQTPRKLLLRLRVMAIEHCVLSSWVAHGGRFVVWGAGRDGKDFVKALSQAFRERVYCLVDVDEKKIGSGSYVHRDDSLNIPIVHFMHLIPDEHVRERVDKARYGGSAASGMKFGKISKSRDVKAGECARVTSKPPPSKKRKTRNKLASLDPALLRSLPVVVCVAMYRTGGALEANVQQIGRIEGQNLWHFS